MKRFGKIVWWALWNTGMVLLCYDAIVKGLHLQWNVFRFLTWASFIGTIAFYGDGGTERRERTVPDWLNTGVDLVLCLACVAYGHFILGTAWFLAAPFNELGYDKNHKKFPVEDQA